MYLNVIYFSDFIKRKLVRGLFMPMNVRKTTTGYTLSIITNYVESVVISSFGLNANGILQQSAIRDPTDLFCLIKHKHTSDRSPFV